MARIVLVPVAHIKAYHNAPVPFSDNACDNKQVCRLRSGKYSPSKPHNHAPAQSLQPQQPVSLRSTSPDTMRLELERHGHVWLL